MQRGFAAVFIACLILLQITIIADNQVLSLKMDTSEKDEQQGHDSSNLTGVELALIQDPYLLSTQGH